MTHYIQLKLRTLTTKLNKGDFSRTSLIEGFGKCVSRRHLKNVLCCKSNVAILTSRGSRTSPGRPSGVTSAARLGSSYTDLNSTTPITDSQVLLSSGVNGRFSKPLQFSQKSQPYAASSWLPLLEDIPQRALRVLPAARALPCVNVEQCKSAFRGTRPLYLGPFLAQQHNDTEKSGSRRVAEGGQATF